MSTFERLLTLQRRSSRRHQRRCRRRWLLRRRRRPCGNFLRPFLFRNFLGTPIPGNGAHSEV